MVKTIIISITVIICTILLCSTVVYVNCIKLDSYTNYSITGNGTFSDPFILKDLKTGKIYSINTVNKKIIITDLINNSVSYMDYIQNGSASSMKDPRELGKEQYLEKVKNGTNTSADDRRAEINGWLDN